MPREYRQQIDDILDSISYINEYISGMDFGNFADDKKTQDAVIRNLEIIGEAARALPNDIKEKTNSVEWHKIIALRNILIHEYFGINLALVWDVVQNKLEKLETQCRYLL